tara:strand:+ start:488 stop:928 length:441 start_codon:yes stop_codon:yes gene_type:complete
MIPTEKNCPYCGSESISIDDDDERYAVVSEARCENCNYGWQIFYRRIFDGVALPGEISDDGCDVGEMRYYGPGLPETTKSALALYQCMRDIIGAMDNGEPYTLDELTSGTFRAAMERAEEALGLPIGGAELPHDNAEEQVPYTHHT